MLEEAVSDFNKDLNPLIKQRKVEVRHYKRNNLMTVNHFLKFGKSDFVQNLISHCSSNQGPFSIGYSIDFRNYLIASLVIGNGLRASNIMELTIKDITDFTIVEGYEGHKVIVNDNYKTSTIYGEKFIVTPDRLHDHLIFYINRLRSLVTNSLSKKVFTPSGQVKMTQTNVGAALTSAFQKAKVFSKKENDRVSCTRIRCALATFACNDGGFETAFFAKHFMKNKEETTSMHYNLHSHRRHALNIAMKLYESFSCNGNYIYLLLACVNNDLAT